MMFSHWGLSENKFSKVSRTLHSILTDLNNAVVSMGSTRYLFSKSFSPCVNPLVTVPRAPILIGITVTFMLHSFFNSLTRSRDLFLFSSSLNFILRSAGTANPKIRQILFYSLIIIRCGHLAEIRWSICMSESQRNLYVSFSRRDSELCIHHLFVWSNLDFLHISQCITLSTQSWLVLYSFRANLRHSPIMWLVVSSLSPHNLDFAILLFLTYSCFNMICPYGLVLCCFQKRLL